VSVAISPEFDRTFEQREHGQGTGVQTRLVFMTSETRSLDDAFDVTHEAYIAHHGRFFTLAQFAVYAVKVVKARGEPVPQIYGWNGLIMPAEAPTVADQFVDLAGFARLKPLRPTLTCSKPINTCQRRELRWHPQSTPFPWTNPR